MGHASENLLAENTNDPRVATAENAPVAAEQNLAAASNLNSVGRQLSLHGLPPGSSTNPNHAMSASGTNVTLTAPSEDGSKSSDHTSNDSLEATRLPGYMEGFASGYAQGRAAGMLESQPRSGTGTGHPDDMEPVEEISFYASGERKRCRSACVNCRETRIRCVMLRCGSCSGCIEQGIECVQNTTKKKRGPPKKDARMNDKNGSRMLMLAPESWERSAKRYFTNVGDVHDSTPAAAPIQGVGQGTLRQSSAIDHVASRSFSPSVQGVQHMFGPMMFQQRPPQLPIQNMAQQMGQRPSAMHLSQMMQIPTGMYDGQVVPPTMGVSPQPLVPMQSQQVQMGDQRAYQNYMMQLQALIQQQQQPDQSVSRLHQPSQWM